MLYTRKYPHLRAAQPQPEPPPAPPVEAPAESPPQPDLAAAVARLDELQRLYEAEGWRPIQAIGAALGVTKHPDGWDSSLLRIIEAEFSAEIAAALEDSADAVD
jgi:hypothetical protein